MDELKALSYMKLKKALVEKGIDKAEVDKCPGKPELLVLAVNKGIVEGEEPAAPQNVSAPAPAEAAPPAPAPAPAAPVDDPFEDYEGTMQEKELAYLCDWIRKNGTPSDQGIEVTFGELFDGTGDLLDTIVGTIRSGRKKKLLKSEAEVFFKGQSDAEKIYLIDQ